MLKRLVSGSLSISKRCFTAPAAAIRLLEHRALVQMSGDESFDFLQGMITNDVFDLEEDGASQYAMMLNTQGRVEQDLIVTRVDQSTLLLECNRQSADKFCKTLKRYRLRRKIKIDIRDDLQVWHSTHKISTNDEAAIQFADPRLNSLGFRLLTSSDVDCMTLPIDTYNIARFQLGIPEGPAELVPGKSLPLECNLEFMNGVSFMKGCYIGQELTARTHFTGVIRKRILPLKIITGDCQPGDKIYPSLGSRKSAGKLVALHGEYAIGLVRLQYLSDELLVTKNGAEIKGFKPEWWPHDDSANKDQDVV